jgi:hypothetical protein
MKFIQEIDYALRADTRFLRLLSITTVFRDHNTAKIFV